MTSNWKVFWSYPVIYLSGVFARAWYGQLHAIETECFLFSVGWVLILLTSIWLDRLFGRVSTSKTDQEKEVIRRFVQGERASLSQRKKLQNQSTG